MKTILRKSIIYLIGNFSAKILSSLIIPIYAVYLSSSALGEFDYIQTLMNIIGPIATVAIWESVLKFNLDINSSEKNKRELFSNAVFVVLISSMLIILSLLIYNSYFSIFKTSVFLSITMILLTPYLMLFQYFQDQLTIQLLTFTLE
jgi:O-antigen/teichoic acid export membrane protein